MRKVRIISLLLTLCFLAVDVFAALILYKSYKDKKSAKAATPEQASATVVRASNDSNPYEDPNDPNTTEEGTCFSTETMTGYFMEIKLSQQTTGIVKSSYADNWEDWSGATKWSNKTHYATAVLTFVDMKYNGQPIFVSVFTKVRYKAKFGQSAPRLWAQEDFTEENDNAIRIPASYYNYMQWEMQNHGASLRRFNLTYLKNNGKDVMPLKYAQEIDVRLYTKDIPADSDDPISPNFKLDNWSGIMSAIKNGTGCGSASCSNAWGTIKIVLIVIAVAFGVAIVVWLLRMFIGLLRGK